MQLSQWLPLYGAVVLGTLAGVVAIDALSPRAIYATDSGGAVFKSTDGGTSVSPARLATTRDGAGD
jgi:photosystem II stability/assembly factor-like uncharacterized protein